MIRRTGAGKADRSLEAALPNRERLEERLGEIGLETDGVDLAAARRVLAGTEEGSDAQRDALSTQLMEIFRLHQSRAAFGQLYELNRRPLLQQVAARLRRYHSKADPNDVLQEVFVNIYRYPHRFNCARDDAFRV